jgi:hypothetical protein
LSSRIRVDTPPNCISPLVFTTFFGWQQFCCQPSILAYQWLWFGRNRLYASNSVINKDCWLSSYIILFITDFGKTPYFFFV